MRTPQGIAARISVVYAVVAIGWILGSGLIVTRLPQPLESMAEIGKGLLFVLVTSLLLYLVIARWIHTAADSSARAAGAERELARVVDTVPVGMLLLDARGVVTFMNPAAEQLLGVSAESCVGRPLEELCGMEQQEEFAVSVSELLATGSIEGLELPVSGGSGGRPVIARSAHLDSRTRGGGWVVALADNTTGQAQTERSKRLLEGYRLISEMAAVVGRTRDAAQLFRQLCRLAVEVGGFKAAWAVVRNEDGSGYVTAGMVGLGEIGSRVAEEMLRPTSDGGSRLSRQLAEAEIVIDNHLDDAGDSPWRATGRKRGLGSYAAFAILDQGVMQAGALLFTEAPGHFGVEERKLLITLKTDLTYALERLTLDARRADAEEALARSEEGYRELFDAYPQPMWVYSLSDLTFLAVNKAAVDRYGFSREQLATMTIKDVRPADEVPQLLKHVGRKGRGLADSGFWTHRDASGRDFPVHVLTHDIRWNGQEAELVMVQEVAHM